MDHVEFYWTVNGAHDDVDKIAERIISTEPFVDRVVEREASSTDITATPEQYGHRQSEKRDQVRKPPQDQNCRHHSYLQSPETITTNPSFSGRDGDGGGQRGRDHTTQMMNDVFASEKHTAVVETAARSNSSVSAEMAHTLWRKCS